MSTHSTQKGIYTHIILILVLVNAIVFKMAVLKDKQWYWLLAVTASLLIIVVYKHRQGGSYPVARRRKRQQFY